jgi:glycosyltransferase involved in cell wall biosynthesis
MKKTVLIIHELKHVGGGQTYADNLTRSLRRRKDINLISLEADTNVEIIRKLFLTSPIQVIWNIYSAKYFISICVSAILRKKNTIIIYGLWFLESISCRWQIPPWKEKIKLFFSDVEFFLSQLFVFIFMSEVVHLSEYGKQLYKQYYWYLNKKEKIMYPGLDESFSNSKISKLVARNKIGVGANSFMLLMLGRIDFRKNYHLALDLLKELKKVKQFKNAELIYVFSSSSEGNDFSLVQFLFNRMNELTVGSSVKIFSGIKRDEIHLFYRSADAYLMLSDKYETFGLVTLEALTCGLPVFGLLSSATPEILGKYSSKFLVAPKDFRILSKKMSAYFKQDVRSRRKVMEDLEKSLLIFQWKKSVQVLLS